MNRLKSYSRKIMLLFIVILLPALVVGCGDWKGGNNAPAVSSTVSAHNEINVPTNRKISAIFTEAMNPATITTASFTVSGPGTTPVAGIVSYTGVTATFTPANLLAANTEYTATITTGASNTAGIATASNYVWKFTTGITMDTTAPTVTSTGAANGATGLPINRVGTAIFNEAMDPLTISTATYTTTSGATATPVAGTVTYAGVTATFTPAATLTPNTTYTSTITTGAKNLAGNPMASNYVWSWTTGADADTTAPTVTSTGAANGATGLPINRASTAIFSEQMNPLTITTATFKVTSGLLNTPVAGTVTYAGATATFTPAATLTPNTTYTSTITTSAKDLAGNPMASNYVWSWTTGADADTTAPTVTSTGAANGATGLPINRASTAIFSEQMNPLTITTTTFKVTSGLLNTPVAGTVTYAGVTATFTPAATLTSNTTYTSTITTSAKDLAGNPMASNYVWSWTTGAAPDVGLPTVISTIPADTATGVLVNTNVSATFSEQLNPLTVTNQTFTLKQGAKPVAGLVTYEGTTATFNPANDLTPNTDYTATISGGVNGVKDLADNTLVNDKVWSFKTAVVSPAGQAMVPLGTAARFAILSNSAITNIPSSAIVGDVGVSPGARSSIAGLTIPEVTLGAIYAADDAAPVPAMLIAAKADAEIAFLNANAAVRGTPIPLSGNINGLTLVPGLYESGSSIEISPGGILYLDAGGNPNAVFIIRSATSITTSPTSEVRLSGNANAANIFWTAGSAITIGVDSKMKGTLIAGTSVSLLTRSRLDGRALIQGAAAGQVSLDQSTVVKP